LACEYALASRLLDTSAHFAKPPLHFPDGPSRHQRADQQSNNAPGADGAAGFLFDSFGLLKHCDLFVAGLGQEFIQLLIDELEFVESLE
jgi:hypothetical protein